MRRNGRSNPCASVCVWGGGGGGGGERKGEMGKWGKGEIERGKFALEEGGGGDPIFLFTKDNPV